jgi:hypothetical protein
MCSTELLLVPQGGIEGGDRVYVTGAMAGGAASLGGDGVVAFANGFAASTSMFTITLPCQTASSVVSPRQHKARYFISLRLANCKLSNLSEETRAFLIERSLIGTLDFTIKVEDLAGRTPVKLFALVDYFYTVPTQ